MFSTSVEVPGLHYITDYLSPDEQAQLLSLIDQQAWIHDLKRRVQHYGYRYDYTRRSIDDSLFLGTLPSWCQSLTIRLQQDGWSAQTLDQLIINEYVPGQGISSHTDCIPCFDDTIISLSLGSTCVMNFTRIADGSIVPIMVEPGSLVVMKGESRYNWKRGIPARKTDTYHGKTIVRDRRVSLTFRTIIQPSKRK